LLIRATCGEQLVLGASAVALLVAQGGGATLQPGALALKHATDLFRSRAFPRVAAVGHHRGRIVETTGIAGTGDAAAGIVIGDVHALRALRRAALAAGIAAAGAADPVAIGAGQARALATVNVGLARLSRRTPAAVQLCAAAELGAVAERLPHAGHAALVQGTGTAPLVFAAGRGGNAAAAVRAADLVLGAGPRAANVAAVRRGHAARTVARARLRTGFAPAQQTAAVIATTGNALACGRLPRGGTVCEGDAASVRARAGSEARKRATGIVRGTARRETLGCGWLRPRWGHAHLPIVEGAGAQQHPNDERQRP